MSGSTLGEAVGVFLTNICMWKHIAVLKLFPRSFKEVFHGSTSGSTSALL